MGRQVDRRLRAIRPGEPLALAPNAIHRGAEPGAFFFLFGPSTKPNDRTGDIATVFVNGPLDHHADSFGDNYESLLARTCRAVCGEGEPDPWGDEPAPQYGPPKAVIVSIDSPGGVVSGLNETVRTMRRMFAAAGIPSIAYVNELCASAAYAIATSCDEIVLPPSGILGSVGVISTICSQARADDAAGLDYVTLASGDRKADGHIHMPIADGALVAEQGRVDALAKQFFALVAEKRGVTQKTLRSYEAGLFLGKQAVNAGLADRVMGFPDMRDVLAAEVSAA
jgi:peptidase S49-like protein